jgi:integrase
VRARHRGGRTHYYLDTGAKPRKEIPLGNDYVIAIQKWAELTMSGRTAAQTVTFRVAAEFYFREIVPHKAPRTQSDNLREIQNLYKFFDDPPVVMDDIEPHHVTQYLSWRIKAAIAAVNEKNEDRLRLGRKLTKVSANEGHVRANREKALFSHIWNTAREHGLTNKPNPCAGVKGHKETGRDIYVEDDVYIAVLAVAEPPLRDLLELAYLTGQRPADVRKMTRADERDGALLVKQNKGGKKVRFRIEGELAAVMQRMQARNANSLMLINNEHGQPMTYAQMRGAFDRARDAAVAAHPLLEARIREYQVRDLRAKAGTDTEDGKGMEAAQAQLGHTTVTMTAHYVRNRRGKLVPPTK